MRGALMLVVIAVPLVTASTLASQEVLTEESRAILGAALGSFSGGTLGLAAALEPCSRTESTLLCARIATATGTAVGLVAGAALGNDHGSAVTDRARSAGYGALAGVALGVGLQPFIQPYGWTDALALAAVGGAIGAVPQGSAWGAGVGGAVGLVLWRTWPAFDAPDAAALAFVGLAVGGLTEWIARATEDPERAMAMPLSVALPIGR